MNKEDAVCIQSSELTIRHRLMAAGKSQAWYLSQSFAGVARWGCTNSCRGSLRKKHSSLLGGWLCEWLVRSHPGFKITALFFPEGLYQVDVLILEKKSSQRSNTHEKGDDQREGTMHRGYPYYQFLFFLLFVILVSCKTPLPNQISKSQISYHKGLLPCFSLRVLSF